LKAFVVPAEPEFSVRTSIARRNADTGAIFLRDLCALGS
jgi:hypothetical protein